MSSLAISGKAVFATQLPIPSANADVACQSHIACHAAYVAWQLGRKLTFDPAKEEFVGDEAANRMRSRAMREPWRI